MTAAPQVGTAIVDQTIVEDTLWTYRIPKSAFTNPNEFGDLFYTVLLANGQLAPWVGIDQFSDPDYIILSGTPPKDLTGTIALGLSAYVFADLDGDGVATDHLNATQVFNLTITPVNDAPRVATPIADQTIPQGHAWTFHIPDGAIIDVDSENLTFSAQQLFNGTLAPLPSWLTFDAATHTFSGNPPAGQFGSGIIRVTVSDGLLSTTDDFVLHVDGAPTAVAIPNQTILEDTAFIPFTVSPHFIDPDPDGALDPNTQQPPLTYTVTLADGTPLPSWLAYSANFGNFTFSGTPPTDYFGELQIAINASDGINTTADVFKLTVTGVNDAPEVTPYGLDDQSIDEDHAWNFQLPPGSFTDVDGDTLTYSATLLSGGVLPSWIKLDKATGNFSGTPPLDFNGQIDIVLTASDGHLATSDSFTLTVNSVNDAPRIVKAILNQVGTEEKPVNFTVTPSFMDVDSPSPLAYTATLAGGAALPGWLTATFNPNGTVTFTGTPTHDLNGVINLAVTATDDQNASTSSPFKLTIANVNDAPVIGPGGPASIVHIDEDTAFHLATDAFTDVDSTLTYSAKLSTGAALSSWLKFDAKTDTFMPTADANGSATVTVTASDGLLKVSDTFQLVVDPVNDAPRIVVSVADQKGFEDKPVTFTVTPSFKDIDTPGSLSITVTQADGSALPDWLTVTQAGNKYTFTGTPPADFNGVVNLAFNASDGQLSTPDVFKLTVANVNDAPVVDMGIPDVHIDEDNRYVIPADAFHDIDSPTLTYSAKLASGAALPSWLKFDSKSHTFTPIANASGTADIIVTASDGSLSVREEFHLTVDPVNDAPHIVKAIPDQAGIEEKAVSFKVTPNFADIDSPGLLIYTATLANGSALPGWLTATFANGVFTFTGTPPVDLAGVIDLAVTASDGALSTSDTFKLTLANVNDAPVVATPIADTTIDEDTAFVIPAGTFTDVDSATLIYTAKLASGGNLPSWLTFNPATQTFTPIADANGAADVTVTASDGKLTVSDTFHLTVAPVNDAPVLAHAIANQIDAPGQAWTFHVPASTFTDVDDDAGTLTYIAAQADGSALPSWISFNPSTQTFTGTPPADWSGAIDLKVSAADPHFAGASGTFWLSNGGPVLLNPLADQELATEVWSFHVPDHLFSPGTISAATTWTATLASGAKLPSWLKFDAATQTFSGTPPDNFNGDLSFKIVASEGAGTAKTVLETENFSLHNDEVPILIKSVPLDNEHWSYKIPAGSFADFNSSHMTYSATLQGGAALPSWLKFDGATQTFSGTPPNSFAGSIDVSVTASDGTKSVGDTFTIHRGAEFTLESSTDQWDDAGDKLHNFTYTGMGLGGSGDPTLGFNQDKSGAAGIYGSIDLNYDVGVGLITDLSLPSAMTDFQYGFNLLDPTLSKLTDVLNAKPTLTTGGTVSGPTSITTMGGDAADSTVNVNVWSKLIADLEVAFGVYIDPLGVDVSNTFSVPFSNSENLTPLSELQVPNASYAPYLILPFDHSQDLGVSADVGVPTEINTFGTLGAGGPTSLAVLSSSGTTDAFQTGSVDVRKVLDALLDGHDPLSIIESQINDHLQVALGANVAGIDLNVASAGMEISLIDGSIVGSVSLKHVYELIPDIGVTLTSEFGEVVQGHLGDTLQVGPPTYTSGPHAGQFMEGEGSFSVSVEYDLNAILRSSLYGELTGEIDYSLLSAKLFAQVGLEVFGLFAGIRIESDSYSLYSSHIPLGSAETLIGSVDEHFNFGSVDGGVYMLDWERFRSVAVSGDDFTFTTHQIEAIGNDHDNHLIGNTFDNNIVGNLGNDTLSGLGGNDTIFGGSGNDVLDGGAGNDFILGGAGDDIIIGGAGDDDLQGSTILGVPNADLPGPDTDPIGNPLTDHDTFVFAPGSGHDTIWAYDQLSNLPNNRDVIDLSAYKDIHSYDELDIGQGPDGMLRIVIDPQDTIELNGLATPQDLARIPQLFQFVFNPDPYVGPPIKIMGTTGTVAGDGDHIHGRNVDNIIDGGGPNDKGDDTLDGRGGNDTILGWGGDDTLIGGDGNDTLIGGTGSDHLWAGAGSNKLTGGVDDATNPSDFFIFQETGAGYVNTITDFDQRKLPGTSGNVWFDDKIDISRVDANTQMNGLQHWQLGDVLTSMPNAHDLAAGVLDQIVTGTLGHGATIELVGKTEADHDTFDLHIVLLNQFKLLDPTFDMVLS